MKMPLFRIIFILMGVQRVMSVWYENGIRL